MMRKAAIVALLVTSGCMATGVQANDETEFLGIVQQYLEVADQYVMLAKQQEAVMFFAVEGIVEIHEERGEQAKAVPHLKKILEKYPDNLTVRNIVRFKLRDVYKETGRLDLALSELETVIDENR